MKKFKRLLLGAAALLALLASAFPATAREVIKTYDVEIQINKDSSMTVTEHITASVENREINKGIIRVFPVEYEDRQGRRMRVGFKVLGAKIDGRPAQVSVASEGRYKEARIGDPDRTLERGDHTFTITYETTRQLGFFEEYDELYWNVTGNDWIFPILSASCKVKLPDRDFGEGFDTIEWYSGAYGQKGKKTDAMPLPDGTVKTTRTLAAGEGLTIVFTWPKGLITPPPPLPTNNFAGQVSSGAVTLTLVLAWLLFARHRWVVRTDGKAVIPLFYPPNGASPAFTRYIHTLDTDNISFSSAIIGLAVKGALKIQESGDKSSAGKSGTITLIKEAEAPRNLQPEETDLMKHLFGAGKNSLELRQEKASRQSLANAIRALITHMKKIRRELIVMNTSKIFPAVALYALGAAALWFFSPESRVEVSAAAFAGGIIILIGMLRGKKSKRPSFRTFLLSCCKIMVAATPCAMLAIVFFSSDIELGPLLPVGCAVLLAAEYLIIRDRDVFIKALVAGTAITPFLIFLRLLGIQAVLPFIPLAASVLLIVFMRPRLIAYTVKGADLARGVEGLILYMNTAEKDRLEMLNPPEETPQLFERLLPYALALGVAKTWGDRFTKVLQNARYTPTWYSGPSPDIFIRSGGLNSFSSNFDKQVRSSMTTPSSSPGSSSGSSRSGGGGFSGGGGGGGGGRGW